MFDFLMDNKLLCIIVGVAGSGKTTSAHSLAKLIPHAVFISKDLIQNAFNDHDRTGENYEQISYPTLKLLADFADTQLSHNKLPIIEGPFSNNHNRTDERKNWVSIFHAIAKKHKAKMVIFRCIPPSETILKERIEKRGYAWDIWKLQNWEKFKNKEPINFPINHSNVIEIITDAEPDIIAASMASYLKNA
jgi:predicted kinase